MGVVNETEQRPQVRSITDAECEHYGEHGWVKLEGLVDPPFAETALRRFLDRAAEQRDDGQADGDGDGPLSSLFSIHDHVSAEDPWLKSYAHSPELAQAASQLMTQRHGFGGLSGRVRCLQDQILGKPPVHTGGERTPWHQDLNLLPFDRAGGMVIWLALVEIPPERGSLRFLSSRNSLPPLGRVFGRSDGLDLVDLCPGLEERFPCSPPLTLHPGDATVHDFCTIHSAWENTSDEQRWVYLVEFIPAEALYTGQPHRITDGLGLEIDHPPDHPRFPLVEF